MSSEQFLSSYMKIKQLDQEIFDIIDLSVKFEEAEKPSDAIETYKKAITKIEETLALQISIPDDRNSIKSQWDEACTIIHKLKRTKAELLLRIGALIKEQKQITETKDEDLNELECEPSLAMARFNPDSFVTEEKGRPRTYSELVNELRNLEKIESGEKNKLELIFTCDDVKFYRINSNGTVITEDGSCTMRILQLEKDEIRGLNATYFIQIIKSNLSVQITEISDTEDDGVNDKCENGKGSLREVDENLQDNFDAENCSSWLYPLIPNVSPCFQTEYGAFIFPDLEADEYGTSFALFPPSEDQIDVMILEILEAILQCAVLRFKEVRTEKLPHETSTQISESLVKGSQFISQNLIKGAEKTGQFINYSTPYIISKLQRAREDAPPVSSNVQTSVEIAKSVTSVAVGVTGYIAEKVGSATMSLGRFLAPHIQKQGSALVSKTLGVEEDKAQEKVEGVLTVAAGAVEGFGTIYSSLEASAKILAQNLSNSSVKIIEHKYGPSAGSLATHSFDTLGNVINVSQNFNYMTPKGIVKKTAKSAGKAIVEDFRPSTSNTQSGDKIIPASCLYPDLKSIDRQ